MSRFFSFLKKAGKCWLHSWRGDPFEPSEAIIKSQKPSGGTGGLFSMLNSILSAGAAGFTLVTMLVTTVLGVVPVVFDTVVDPDSPLSLQASQEVRANLRVEGFGGPDGTGPALLGGASGGESFLAQMAAFHNTVDVVAELRQNDIDIPIEEIMEILAVLDEISTPEPQFVTVGAAEEDMPEATPAPVYTPARAPVSEYSPAYRPQTEAVHTPAHEHAHVPQPEAETEPAIEPEGEAEPEPEPEQEPEEESEPEQEPEPEEEPEEEPEPEEEDDEPEEEEPQPTPEPTQQPQTTPEPQPEPQPTPQPQQPLTVEIPHADQIDESTFAFVFGDAPFALMVGGGSGTGAVTFEVTQGHNVVSVARYTGVVTVENSGTAVITITKAGNPTGFAPARKDITLYIARRDLSNVSINITSDHIYDGTAQTPTFTVTDGSNNIAVTADFTADFSNNINAGDTALITLTATADGNYTGTATAYFTIARAPGENAPDFDMPTGLNAVFGDTLSNVPLTGNWEWYASATTPVGIAGTQSHLAIFTPASVNFDHARVYLAIDIAQAQQPALTITTPGTLTFGDTFATLEATGGSVGEVTWELVSGDAVSIGQTTGIITIESAGIFTVRATRAGDDNHAPVYHELPLNVNRRAMQSVTVSVPGDFVYNGTAQEPTPIVTDAVGSANLITTDDFEIEWSNNINAGTTATVIITATDDGNYTGIVTQTFEIAPAPLTIYGFAITRIFAAGQTAVENWGALEFVGLQNNETANVNTAGVTGTFANANAGMHDVTFTGYFTMTGGTANPANYIITQPDQPIEGTISRADGTFVVPDPRNADFVPGLTLAGVSLPTNYEWVNPTHPISAGDGQVFPAIFTCPDGNYQPVSGNVVVNIAQAVPNYTEPTGLTATFGNTLASVSLPTGWAWDDATRAVGIVGATNTHPATFTPTDTINFSTVQINLTVAVSRANQTDFAITDPGTITFGDTGVTLATTGGQGDGEVTWTVISGDSVTVGANTGALTIHSIGGTTISATRAGGTNHNPATDTITITVNARNISGFTVGTFNALTFTGDPQTPVATVTYNGLAATGTWDYVTDVGETTTFRADGNFTGTIPDQNPGMNQAAPNYTAPTGLTATYGDTLSNVNLPDGWAWYESDTTPVGIAGQRSHYATYTPADTVNFSTVRSELTVTVAARVVEIAEITVTAPETGQTPDTTADIETGTGFTASAVAWSPNETPFRGGTEYTATVTLTANANHTFTDGLTTATINGETATATITNNGGTATLSFEFDATTTATVTGITIAEQPTNLTYTAGQPLNLAGLEVTLTFNDETTSTVEFDDFDAYGLTADPAHGTEMTVADHDGEPVTITHTANGTTRTAITENLTVTPAWFGSGTEADPWQIWNADDLLAVGRPATDPNHRPGWTASGRFYLMMADVDLSGVDSWTPIAHFGSVFDGGGHRIIGLTSTEGGLFASLELFPNTSVRNVALIDVNITRNAPNTGGIANRLSQGTIENVFVSGNITGTERVGGIVGDNLRTVANSVSIVNVTGSLATTGGIVGNTIDIVRNSVALGESVYRDGAANNTFGRVIGTATRDIDIPRRQNNHARADMTLSFDRNPAFPNSGPSTQDGVCISQGQWNNLDWWRYTAFANSQTDEEWGFMRSWIEEYVIDEIPDLPPGDGSVNNPWRIFNATDLRAVGRGGQHNGDTWGLTQHYRMMADVNLGGTGNQWTPIPTGFTGTFDGGGFTITGLYSRGNTAANAGGLFNEIREFGIVRNVALVDVFIYRTSGASTGGIANTNFRGRIENVFVSGNITGQRTVGGIVGNTATGDSRVLNSVSTAVVSGTEDVGGIAGTAANALAILQNNAALGTSINRNTGSTSGGTLFGRITGVAGTVAQSGLRRNNHANANMVIVDGLRTPAPNVDGQDGANILPANGGNLTWWRDTVFLVGQTANSMTADQWVYMEAWLNTHVMGVTAFSAPISQFSLSVSSNLGDSFAGIVPHGESPAGLLSQAEAVLEAFAAPAPAAFGFSPFGLEPFANGQSAPPPSLDDIAAFLPDLSFPELKTQGEAAPGETVTILALPAPGYAFSHWQNAHGETISHQAELTLLITDNQIICQTTNIIFPKPEYGLTLTAIYKPETPGHLFFSVSDNLGGGFALFGTQPFAYHGTGYPAAYPPGKTEGLFLPGETVTLLALPAPGYLFSHWQNAYGEIISHQAEFALTLTAQMTAPALHLTAIYAPDDLYPPLLPAPPYATLPKEEDYEPIFDDGFDPDPDPDLETDYEPITPEELSDISTDMNNLDTLLTGNQD